MIICPAVTKKAIQHHYDLATLFYRLLWGPHIHHGLWEEEVNPLLAQRRLIDRVAVAVGLREGEKILDVGCGMGGSAVELATHYRCSVTGVTLSPVQCCWARLLAAWHGVRRRVRFCCADAEEVKFSPGAFDVIWTVECSEHFFDKPAFFHRAATWLRAGGRVALCAWLAGNGSGIEPHVQAVGEGFLCPSFGTAKDYRHWLESAGLVVTIDENLTAQVIRTWDICHRRVQMSGVGVLGRLAGRSMRQFLNRFTALGDAYRNGAMQYGLLVAERPAS
jgi:tocopherol O-methyltransferase